MKIGRSGRVRPGAGPSGWRQEGAWAGRRASFPTPCDSVMFNRIKRFRQVPERRQGRGRDGFTLVEILVSLSVLTFGLLAAAQVVHVALTSTTLARSKSAAAVAAQSRLELLSDLFGRNPEAEELANGSHGPVAVEVASPADGRVLNRFSVGWSVTAVADPRPGRSINAKQVTVTVTPVDEALVPLPRALLSKVVTMSTVFSARFR